MKDRFIAIAEEEPFIVVVTIHTQPIVKN